MKQHRQAFPVEKMCSMFNISKSSYYQYLSGKASKRWLQNEVLVVAIKDIFEESKESYGSPRIKVELASMGHIVSQPKVARMMQANGLAARKPKKFTVTTDSKHKYPVAPNLLDRQFDVSKKSQVWVSDITYIRTYQGWMYLTVVIDLCDRKVIGWAMSSDMTAQNTSISALRMAIKNRPVEEGLIFHSDRGVQYACGAFTNILKHHEITQSMSRKGNCWDNAVAESFFKTLKTEWVYKQNFVTRKTAELSIFQWIETWYNRKRRHSHLGYKTIEEFEYLFFNHNLAA